MERVIGLIHATAVAIEPMRNILKLTLPQVKPLNFMDEGLLKKVRESGKITPDIVRRLISLAVAAQESGAELGLLTCSSFSSTADIIQEVIEIPIVAIDDAMLREAVSIGDRIGVVATTPSAIESAQNLLGNISNEMSLAPKITTILVEDAFQALLDSDIARHNSLVRSTVVDLAPNSDVIVLAQASMARVVEVLHKMDLPVLSSPHFAAQKIKEILQC